MTHPNPVVEQPQDWYFTFGHGQKHRVTGEDLMGSYVVINGTYLEARQQMVEAFGTKWCDQYDSADGAGVERFSLRRIELPPPFVVEQAPPVTPAEERTGEQDQPPLSMLLDAYSAWISRSVQVLLDPGRGPVSDILETSANADKVRAEIIRRFEERTEVSDLQHAAREELAYLRRLLDAVSDRFLVGESVAIFGTLCRIERMTRGEPVFREPAGSPDA